ncbi:MAG TPA: tryptophan--tRNA ligase [Patescibacteria group bacterium]
MKDVIVSGIQPSGEMHIGNYLGALKDFVELQDKYECFFFIADLHSLTEDFDPKEKSKQIMDLAETFLAVGLDPKKCTMFIQSHIPAHSELAWILNTVTPMNELERMTQYKDKANRQKKNINAGLLNYPVLQAADILLYHPQLVPVGHDQVQHLEMTNLIAKKFNNRYGEYFKEIKAYNKKPYRIMSLVEPEKKMSKSEPESTINIFDEPDMIKKKLAKAVTATDAPKGTVPKGVQNLFDLLELFGNPKLLQKFQKEYNDNTIKYSELKTTLADSISEYFSPIRATKTKMHKNQDQVVKIFQAGAAKAAITANQTLTEVKTKLGLL